MCISYLNYYVCCLIFKNVKNELASVLQNLQAHLLYDVGFQDVFGDDYFTSSKHHTQDKQMALVNNGLHVYV